MLSDLAAESRWPPIRFVRRTSMLVLIRLKLTRSGSPGGGHRRRRSVSSGGRGPRADRQRAGPVRRPGGRQDRCAAQRVLERRGVVVGDSGSGPVPVAPDTPQQRRTAPLAAAGGQLQHQQAEPARGVQFTARCPDLPGHGLEPAPRAPPALDDDQLDRPVLQHAVPDRQLLDRLAVAIRERRGEHHQRRQITQRQEQLPRQLPAIPGERTGLGSRWRGTCPGATIHSSTRPRSRSFSSIASEPAWQRRSRFSPARMRSRILAASARSAASGRASSPSEKPVVSRFAPVPCDAVPALEPVTRVRGSRGAGRRRPDVVEDLSGDFAA